MKLYADKPGASTNMITDDEFIESMSKIIKKEDIQYVFESGTYFGTGSTLTLAKLFVDNNKLPANFITVEANLEYYKTAKKNLAKYKFIEPVFGLSVDYLEAVKFLVSDDIFNNLEKYPDIFIDHIRNPQHFYLQEIMIGIFQDRIDKSKNDTKNFFGISKKTTNNFKNNVLSDFCNTLNNKTSLIILDSAAGIGFYEFLQVKKLMGNKKYYLVLDDIDHLKHYRSWQHIENNPEEFKLIGLNKESGWLIAKSLSVANGI